MFDGFWEGISEFGAEAMSSVTEFGGEYIDGAVDLALTKQKEAAKDPELLTQVTPVKGTRTDGSTIVASAPQPLISGVDNKVLYAGGGFVLLLTVVLLARK